VVSQDIEIGWCDKSKGRGKNWAKIDVEWWKPASGSSSKYGVIVLESELERVPNLRVPS